MTDLEQQLQTRLDKAVEVFKQKEAEIAELKNIIETKDKEYYDLKNTYDGVYTELKNLKDLYEMLNTKYKKRKEQLVELQSMIDLKGEDNNKLLKVSADSTSPNNKNNVIPNNFTLHDFGNTFSI